MLDSLKGPSQFDLDALRVLTECLSSTPKLTHDDIRSLYAPHSKRKIAKMFDEGKTWGEVSSGALDFLNDPNAREYIKSIDDDLGAQVDIVSRSFAEFLAHGEIPAPHYPWRICVILRKAKLRELEFSFLQAWSHHFARRGNGTRYESLLDRLAKMKPPSAFREQARSDLVEAQ